MTSLASPAPAAAIVTGPAPAPGLASAPTAASASAPLIDPLGTHARFTPLGLDALNERAELLTRVDRKYVLDRDALPLLLDAMGAGAAVLEIDGRRAFGYASTYFDTPGLHCFRGTALKRRRRVKIRTRHYLDTGVAFLEVKTRGVRGATVKERLKVDPERPALDAAALAFLDERLAPLGLPPARELALQPVLTSRYERTTLLTRDTTTRVTIDTSLRWSTPDGSRLEPRRTVIAETKSPGAAGDVDHALWRAGHRPDRISKFATGLAALRPELPANRWHRLLAGDRLAA